MYDLSMNRSMPLLGIAVVLVISATGCGSGNDSAAPAPTALVACGGKTTQRYAVYEGVDPNLNSLDLWRPKADDRGACSDRPLVVWVHGGGWWEGDKTDDITDKVKLFTDAGYAFASINYRLTNPDLNPPQPQYPVHDLDGANAVKWLVAHAAEIGVDPERIAIFGHSAGGGIVAAITTDQTYLHAYDLKLTDIRCAGSIDGEGYDVTVGATHSDPRVYPTYQDAFGTDPNVWKMASPMNHIAPNKGIPPTFIAARGPDMRLDLHHEFVAALRAAGVPTTVYDAQDLNHENVSTNIGAPGDNTVTPPLMNFLANCFAR
jgi:acetyl esterase/lipase